MSTNFKPGIENILDPKVGDIVYPAYDGKVSRTTKCKIVKVSKGVER